MSFKQGKKYYLHPKPYLILVQKMSIVVLKQNMIRDQEPGVAERGGAWAEVPPPFFWEAGPPILQLELCLNKFKQQN